MGKRTHGPHLIHAIETNDHGKVHEILAVQVRSKQKIRELCVSDVKRLASEHFDCPLMVAASIPDPFIIKYLIAKHGVDCNFVYKQGSGKRVKTSTPLIHAVRRGLYPTVDVLLSLNVDMNFQDQKGRSALHHSIKKANFKMSKMLLSRGANSNAVDNGNNTPLHIATKYGHVELAKLLLQYSADMYKRGHFGGLPIHIAAKEGHIALVQLFCAREVSVNTKVPCYTEMREKSPLHVAAEEGHKEMVLALIEEFGAEVNMPDSEGETSLHCTVLNEYDPYGMKGKDDFVEAAKIIIQCGADVNIRNGRGETPLHLAARNEFQKVVELLIVAGADPLIEDNDKNKAIDLVSEDDTVSLQALKRAVTDREKYVNQLLESRARGLSNSITSMPGRMMGSMTSLNYGGQPINMSRTLSNPVLLAPQPGEQLIYQDGFVRPYHPRDRLGSIGSMGDPMDPFNRNVRAGSMRSLQHDQLAFDRVQRPGSMRSLHSTGYQPGSSNSSMIYQRMEDPYSRLDNSDVASLASVSTTASQVNGERQVRRKTSSELNRLAGRHPGDVSSDSSQYDEIPPEHQKVLNIIQNQGAPNDMTTTYNSTPIQRNPNYQGVGVGHSAGIYQSQGQMQRQINSLTQQGIYAATQAATEPSNQTQAPEPTFSTFQENRISQEIVTPQTDRNSPKAPLVQPDRNSPKAPLAQPETDRETEDEEAVYQNMPADYNEPVAAVTQPDKAPQSVAPASNPPMLKPLKKPELPANPPRLKPQPKPKPVVASQVQQRQQQIADQMRQAAEKKQALAKVPQHATSLPVQSLTNPSSPTKSQISQPTPIAQESSHTTSPPQDKKITLQISKKQTLTISPSKDNTPSSSSMNQEWRQLPEQMINNGPNLDDSDDTFFDDASFDTLSDCPEAIENPNVRPEPLNDYVVEPMTPSKVDDPKFKGWITDQAKFIMDRQSSQEDSPVSPTSPPPALPSMPPPQSVPTVLQSPESKVIIPSPTPKEPTVADENSNIVKKKKKTKTGEGKKKKVPTATLR